MLEIALILYINWKQVIELFFLIIQIFFPVDTMKWSILSNASLPSPRYGHCAFEFKDKLFIFGGLTKHDEFADNSLFYYNIS